MEKLYNRIYWKNLPSRETAIGESNLNRIEAGIDSLDDQVVALDAAKLSIETANTMVKSFAMDQTSGVITVTLLNGTVYTWDLNIEKIPVSLSMTSDAVLVLTTADGEQYTADLKKLIDTYLFPDSDTIAFRMASESDGKHVTGEVKEGSIEARHLNPDYLADLQVEAARAQGQAELSAEYAAQARRWAVGGVVPEDAEDNSKYYAQQAKLAAEQAKATVDLNLPEFWIDADTMHLNGTFDKQYDVWIEENGHLNMEITAREETA